MIQDACFTPVTSNMELPIDSKNSFLSKRLNSPRLNKIRYFIYNHPTRFGMEALPEDGKAKYIFKNGAWYEGEWKNGKRNGSGTLTNLKNRDSSGSYSGEWKDDLMHGKGILSPEVLMWIEGNFENGVIDEENITIFSGIYENEGRKFIGKTKNFEMWEGTLFDNEGNVISKFVNGKEEK